jgi:hypothetical protein
VRVLDLVFLRRAEDGTLGVAEISDLEASELGEMRASEAELAMVLPEQHASPSGRTGGALSCDRSADPKEYPRGDSHVSTAAPLALEAATGDERTD